MILKGRKVVLRAIEKDDLEFLRMLTNDPEIEKMVKGYSFPVSRTRQEAWFEEFEKQSDPLRWIIEMPDKTVVGTITLGDFDWKNRVAHLTGIKLALDRIKEGGIAVDAMMVVIKYAFDELNLNRLEGGYIEYNKQSMALNRMVGFVDEGRLRQAVYKNGNYHDYIITALIKEDYLSRKKHNEVDNA
jgi:RimJ/RimL family protein N-acetyltransferase